MCYFGFSAFWIVLNILVQQVNVTEVKVSVKIEQKHQYISHDRVSLTDSIPPENIRKPYTPSKHQKTLHVSNIFKGV